MYLRLASNWPRTCYVAEDDPDLLSVVSGPVYVILGMETGLSAHSGKHSINNATHLTTFTLL